MTKKIKADQDNITNWVQLGSDITGNVAGTALGGLLAGVPGALLGASLAPLITETFSKIGSEIKTKIYGNREEIRIGAAFTFALSKINERLEEGQKPRDDSYFKAKSNQRAASEEILEATLRLAQTECEELKVKHYGYLIANIYFDSNIDRGYANLLLKLANRLSYRQLTMLELLANGTKYELIRRKPPVPGFIDLTRYSTMPAPLNYSLQLSLKTTKADLAVEVKELLQADVIAELDFKPGLIPSDHFINYGLTSIGKALRDLMELKELNETDVAESANWLRYIEGP